MRSYFRRGTSRVLLAVALAGTALVTIASECPFLPSLTLTSVFFDLSEIEANSPVEPGEKQVSAYLTDGFEFRVGTTVFNFRDVGGNKYIKLEDDSFGLEYPGVWELWVGRTTLDTHEGADWMGVELLGGAFARRLPDSSLPTVIVTGYYGGSMVGEFRFPIVQSDQRMRADFNRSVDWIDVTLNGGSMSFRSGEIFGDSRGGSHL